jgi:hypothetical protein
VRVKETLFDPLPGDLGGMVSRQVPEHPMESDVSGPQFPPQQPPGPPPGWQPPGGPPQSGYPQSGYPQSGYPPAGHPRPAYTQAGYAQPGYPQRGYPQPGFGQAPAGWPVPPPITTKRIPDDLPFVVHPSLRKRSYQFAGVFVFAALLLACPIGLSARSGPDGWVGVVIFGLVLVLLAGLVGLQMYLMSTGGPVLAVGPAGVWIKTRPTRGQAIWLPWEGIERVYRRRWSFEKMICVKARDPRVGANLGLLTAFDSSLQQVVFGSGLTATANFADKPEQEIVAALTHFSAGRCPVS